MNLSGVFRDDHPRLSLLVPGLAGQLAIEFIVDTGFAGDLALPQFFISRLEADMAGSDSFALADGSRLTCPVYEIMLDWDSQEHFAEVLVLDGEPLIGTRLVREMLLQAEMVEGKIVQIDPL